jgi:hypothetical protein
MKIRQILAALISLIIGACSIFTPLMLEQHQWGSLTLHPGYQYVSQEHSDSTWELSYELNKIHTFEGQVRHTSRINESKFPMLTHDILITSGEFSDSDIVRTSVMNHRFIWSSNTAQQPQGTINLLHTMPIDEATLNGLYEIKHGDSVTVKGYEIYTIKYNKDGLYKGMWKDSGCNTLLVTEVIIHDSP